MTLAGLLCNRMNFSISFVFARATDRRRRRRTHLTVDIKQRNWFWQCHCPFKTTWYMCAFACRLSFFRITYYYLYIIRVYIGTRPAELRDVECSFAALFLLTVNMVRSSWFDFVCRIFFRLASIVVRTAHKLGTFTCYFAVSRYLSFTVSGSLASMCAGVAFEAEDFSIGKKNWVRKNCNALTT